jgi:chromate transporter
MPPFRPSLRELLRAFLVIGLTSFGGGRTAYFQDALVARRKWLTDDEFLEAVAVSQVLPGPNIGNLAAYLGQRLHGAVGAVLAVLCLTVPGGLAMLGVAWLYFNGMPASVTGPLGGGVSAASAGIAAAAVIRLRGGARGPDGMFVAALTFTLFGPLGWPIHFVLLACLPPSFALAWRRRR